MSALERIDDLGDCYLTPGVHKRLMALVEQHAHELAEKIRAQKVREPDGEVEEHVNYVIDHLANEIDPKKEGQ